MYRLQYKWLVMFAPVVMIGVIHIIGGMSAIYAPEAVSIMQLYGLRLIFGNYPDFLGALLVIVGVLAISARFIDVTNKQKLWLVCWQQFVCLLQLAGVIYSISIGAYPDGYVPAQTWFGSSMFILGDQAPLIVLTFTHTFEFFSFLFERLPSPLRAEVLTRHNHELIAELQILKQQLASRDEAGFWEELVVDIKQDLTTKQ